MEYTREEGDEATDGVGQTLCIVISERKRAREMETESAYERERER